jgi:hypothetical protein
MTDTQLQRMAEAAVDPAGGGAGVPMGAAWHRRYGKGAVMTLLHPSGDPLRPYCDYDCNQYKKIEALSDALSEIGLFVEDCTGDYSGVYEKGSL